MLYRVGDIVAKNNDLGNTREVVGVMPEIYYTTSKSSETKQRVFYNTRFDGEFMHTGSCQNSHLLKWGRLIKK